MEQQQQPASSNAQLIAVISYLTLVGWIIAFVLHQNDKSELGIFHIRQSLGINIIGVVGWVVFWIPLIGWLAAIFLFVIWIMGLISAAQGEMKPVPLLGKFFQDIFKGIQ
ncbi:MAG: hypothetical protein DRI97_11585 [Bacteroidetes bacterium]|nr:MAG: hypothetical protein DRI97_11585 [Bacteroidota bacterium]RLD79164.1 MAG: hypothetical protein DRJ15_10010 [Bacteroidota bacterium]